MTTARGLASSLAGRPRIVEGVRLDLILELRLAILRAEAAGGTFPSLNVGGWKSDPIFSWPDACVRELAKAIQDEHLGGCRANAWAMVNRDGSHHPRHQHLAAIVSGVYYVDPGGAGGSRTIFELGEHETLEIEPITGRLVIFPSALWHRVPAHKSARPRITIAFDVG